MLFRSVRLGWNGWEHTCVSHQDSYFDSVDLMFSYFCTAFYVTLEKSILHEHEVKITCFCELFVCYGGPNETNGKVFLLQKYQVLRTAYQVGEESECSATPTAL